MPDLPHFDSLKGFVLRTIQSRRVEYTVPDAEHSTFPMVYGLCARTRRLVEAFARLYRGGYAGEGEFLLRAAVEHAVTAQWVYCTRGGYDRFNVQALRDQHSLNSAVLDGSDSPEAAARLAESAAAAAAVNGQDGLPNFSRGILGSLEPEGGFLATTYRVLSQGGHVTHEAVQDFITYDDDGTPMLSHDPVRGTEHELWYVAAACCLLTSWVLAHITENDAELRRLRDISSELQMPDRLDANLPTTERRFADEADIS